jgi:DNA repair exonuclease SbcCD ATPase subunit
MWMLAQPQTSPVMIMDEPFKNASAEFVALISQMVKKISNMLGVQFIVATHIKGMIAEADCIHQIGAEKGEEDGNYIDPEGRQSQSQGGVGNKIN